MEIKDLLGYLGVSSEIDSLDAFKSAFNDKFLPTDQAHTNDAVVARIRRRNISERTGTHI
jgi:hypothetical protein